MGLSVPFREYISGLSNIIHGCVSLQDIATRILQLHTRKESAGLEASATLPLRSPSEQVTVGVVRSPSGELARTRVGGGEAGERQRKWSGEKVSLPLGADVVGE